MSDGHLPGGRWTWDGSACLCPKGELLGSVKADGGRPKISPRAFCLRLGGYLMAARKNGSLDGHLLTIEGMLVEVEDPLDRASGCVCSNYPGDAHDCPVHEKVKDE